MPFRVIGGRFGGPFYLSDAEDYTLGPLSWVTMVDFISMNKLATRKKTSEGITQSSQLELLEGGWEAVLLYQM